MTRERTIPADVRHSRTGAQENLSGEPLPASNVRRSRTANHSESPKGCRPREGRLVNDIIDLYGHRHDLWLWRQQAGAVPVGNNYMRLAPKGAADITGILPDGRRIEIECKRPGMCQSSAQREFEAAIVEMNGVYILAYSVDDVEAGLRRAGYRRSER